MTDDDARLAPVTGGYSTNRPAVLTCLGWGTGGLFTSLLSISVGIMLLRYLTDIAGIGAATAGGILAFSKIYDLLVDPLIGYASDRTRSRWGRRRPFLLAGGMVMCLGFGLLFSIPGGLSLSWAAVYVLAAMLVWSTGYALFIIPYTAMPAEMCSDYHGRTYLLAYRTQMLAIGQVIGGAGGPFLIVLLGATRAGYAQMAWILSAISLLFVIVCFRSTRGVSDGDGVQPSSLPLRQKIRSLYGNRPFMLLISAHLLIYFGLTTIGATNAFYTKHVLGRTDAWLGSFYVILTVAMIVFQPFWLWLSRRIGKQKTAVSAFVLHAACYLSWLLPGSETTVAQLTALVAVLGFASAGVVLMPYSMLADVMDYDARRTGMRREAMMGSIVSLIDKLANAGGVAFTGVFLGTMGYVASKGGVIVQTVQAKSGIVICFSVIPAACALGCALLMSRYDLSEEKISAAELAYG